MKFILHILNSAMLRLFDIHIHLTDPSYYGYLDHILAGLRAMNMVACSVTVDASTAKIGLELAAKNRDIIRNFVGIHPEAAGRENLEEFNSIVSQNLSAIDGVGEIGLDRTYDEKGVAPYAKQKEVFDAMLQIGEREQKPVSIHSRKALDDILEILPSYRIKNVLLHWFSGSKKQLARAAEMGLYVSFGPALVYSEDKRVLLRIAARDRILVETDGPVPFGRCFENLPASPTSFLVSVVLSVAESLRMDYKQAADLLEANSLAYLQLDGKDKIA